MTDTYACGIQMPRPQGNLYKLLIISPSIDIQDIQQLGRDKVLEGDQQYAWKALSDPYYRSVYDATYSTRALFEAGFFNDTLPQLVRDYRVSDPLFPATSLAKISRDGTPGSKAVLISTGGMAPIHRGHIAMMESARETVEQLGYQVMGGFLAPGHDSYVGQKYNGTAAIPVADRIAMVELAVQDSNWLEVDPWAARYLPAEINFTDVVARLENVLAAAGMGDYEVFYVCGDDNFNFINAIAGRVIPVSRTAASSKAIREGDHTLLDPAVLDYWLDYQASTGNLPYLIRNEEDAALTHWNEVFKGGEEEITRRRIQLQSAVRIGFAQLFRQQGQDHKVHLLSVTNQRQAAREVIGQRSTISLDPFFSADYRLDSTRYFNISDSQKTAKYRAERQGCAPLAEQAAGISDGSYVLVEDDSVTGETVRNAIALLPHHVTVEQTVLLSDFAEYAGTEYYDVVDMRDFIFGSEFGGLSVILSSGSRARAPYVLPFVSLRSRAKIPPAAEMEASRVVWQANLRFFRNSGVRISDCYDPFITLACSLGFDPHDSMESFCQWGIDCLMENV